MKPLVVKLSFIVRASIVSVVCSIGIGLIFYQSRIFNPYNHAFTFIVDAAVGALFFFSLRILRLRDALGFLFIMYLVYLGPLTHAFENGAALGFTPFFLSVPLAVYVYEKMILTAHRWESVFPPLIVAGLWGSTTILARLCVDLPRAAFWQGPFLDYPMLILPDVLMGIAVGFGVGVGFFLVDREPVSLVLRSPT